MNKILTRMTAPYIPTWDDIQATLLTTKSKLENSTEHEKSVSHSAVSDSLQPQAPLSFEKARYKISYHTISTL